MRLMPASSAASENELKLRDTPGRSSELVAKGMLSEPKKAASTVAAAPLNVLWPEVYSGKGGVTSSGVQVGSLVVSGLPSISALRMAVMGRQKLNVYLQSQAMIAASASAMFNNANNRAFCSSVLPR